MRKKFSILLKIIIGVAGAFLVVHLVVQIGWREVAGTLLAHPYLILGLTAAYLTYHLLRTLALQICISVPVRFTTLFTVRLAGEAIAYIAVGSIVGDALKVALAKKELPVVEAAKGVFAEKLIYHLAGTAFITGGLCIALVRFGANKIFLYALIGMIVVFLGLFYLMSSGVQPISRLLKRVRVRRPKLREAILQTEQRIFQFRTEHPGKFLLTFIIDLTSYFYSATEVVVILIVLGYSPSLLDVWFYEGSVKAMNTASFVVPGNLGIFETTNVFLAKQIGWGQQAGLLTALIVRIRAIIWAITGYLWFLYLMAKDKKSI